MKSTFALISAISLASCGSDREVTTCPSIEDAAFYQCADEHMTGSFRALVEECLPPVKAASFKGTWASDFEFNQFFVGQDLLPDAAWQIPVHQVSLEIQGNALELYEGDDMARVLYLEFIGRKVPCDILGPKDDAILVDRLISVRVIEERLSDWAR